MLVILSRCIWVVHRLTRVVVQDPQMLERLEELLGEKLTNANDPKKLKDMTGEEMDRIERVVRCFFPLMHKSLLLLTKYPTRFLYSSLHRTTSGRKRSEPSAHRR